MRDRKAEFDALGARVAAVGLGGAEMARAFRAESGIDFPLLVDEAREAYRAAGLRKAGVLDLLRPFNVRRTLEARRAGHRQTKLGKDPFQLGGSFVFGPGDVDLLVRPARTFGDNAPVGDLLAVLRAWRDARAAS